MNTMSIANYQKFMKPSAICQACYSQIQIAKDCIITCQICRSSIHQVHYGSQLFNPPDKWKCERCRYFLEMGTQEIIKCQFCPNLRGIMKQFLFEDKKIWLHPQCATWCYPLIYFLSPKRQSLQHSPAKTQSTFFWAEDFDNNRYPCDVCKQTTGYRLKCKYYSCRKSYHVTCARPLGIVRDLETFRIENTIYYFPVYCREHLQLKLKDYKLRSKMMRDQGQIEKANHFHKLSVMIQAQYKNLKDAVIKCKQEQQMMQKLIIETHKSKQDCEGLQFNGLQSSFDSRFSQKFIDYIQSKIIDRQIQPKIQSRIQEKEMIIMKKNQQLQKNSISQQKRQNDESQQKQSNVQKSHRGRNRGRKMGRTAKNPQAAKPTQTKKTRSKSNIHKKSNIKQQIIQKIEQDQNFQQQGLQEYDLQSEIIRQNPQINNYNDDEDNIMAIKQQNNPFDPDQEQRRYGHQRQRSRKLSEQLLQDVEQQEWQQRQQLDSINDNNRQHEFQIDELIIPKNSHKNLAQFSFYEQQLDKPIQKPQDLQKQRNREQILNLQRIDEQIRQQIEKKKQDKINKQYEHINQHKKYQLLKPLAKIIKQPQQIPIKTQKPSINKQKQSEQMVNIYYQLRNQQQSNKNNQKISIINKKQQKNSYKNSQQVVYPEYHRTPNKIQQLEQQPQPNQEQQQQQQQQQQDRQKQVDSYLKYFQDY